MRIDSPYQLQVPKRLYTALKIKAKKEPKKESKKEVRGKKMKQEPDTAEYIALMEVCTQIMITEASLPREN